MRIGSVQNRNTDSARNRNMPRVAVTSPGRIIGELRKNRIRKNIIRYR